MKTLKTTARLLALAPTIGLALSVPASAHHSFAMYDLDRTIVVTGVVTRVDPAPNHMIIQFARMNDERKNVIRDEAGEPVVWSVEMQGSAQMARQGVTVSSFAPGTVFSVGMHPTRAGDTAGFREGGMFRCPDRTPPAPGMHCDSVEGSVQIGTESLPEATE